MVKINIKIKLAFQFKEIIKKYFESGIYLAFKDLNSEKNTPAESTPTQFRHHTIFRNQNTCSFKKTEISEHLQGHTICSFLSSFATSFCARCTPHGAKHSN